MYGESRRTSSWTTVTVALGDYVLVASLPVLALEAGCDIIIGLDIHRQHHLDVSYASGQITARGGHVIAPGRQAVAEDSRSDWATRAAQGAAGSGAQARRGQIPKHGEPIMPRAARTPLEATRPTAESVARLAQPEGGGVRGSQQELGSPVCSEARNTWTRSRDCAKPQPGLRTRMWLPTPPAIKRGAWRGRRPLGVAGGASPPGGLQTTRSTCTALSACKCLFGRLTRR